jgi:endonuclease-3
MSKLRKNERNAKGKLVFLIKKQYLCHHYDMSFNKKNNMNRKERYEQILAYFEKQMPEVTTELEFGNVFQLLVAVVLSAQCTDKRINQVTPELFRHFPDARSMAAVEPDEVFEYIKSVSYPNAKAKHLVDLARMIVERHEGEVPTDMNQLLDLPGVGRKTANVIQAVAFGRATMAVDTHVFRVSHRLGLVSKKDNTPYKVEQALMRNIPDEMIPRAHHWLLLHGRYVCTSRRPHCEKCELSQLCPKLMEGSVLTK